MFPAVFQGSLEEWRKLNVLNYEMESATLLTPGLRIRTESGYGGFRYCSERERMKTPDDSILPVAEERLASCIREALSLYLTGERAIADRTEPGHTSAPDGGK